MISIKEKGVPDTFERLMPDLYFIYVNFLR